MVKRPHKVPAKKIYLRDFRTRLRRRRNLRLCRLIDHLCERDGKPVRVLDVGGSPYFWETVDSFAKCEVHILNLDAARESEAFVGSHISNMHFIDGDACDMANISDKSYDLVVSNSVIEHVGGWTQIECACTEMYRVGCNGWVQTPAVEFPLEVHLVVPFVHWFNRPIQRALLQVLPFKNRRDLSVGQLRQRIERINLLSRNEMRWLFPNLSILTERYILLPKSYIAVWTDDDFHLE